MIDDCSSDKIFEIAMSYGSEDSRFVRKFDNALNDERAHLERLHYHTLNEVSFIANLNDELGRVGLLPENEKKKNDAKADGAGKEPHARGAAFLLRCEFHTVKVARFV